MSEGRTGRLGGIDYGTVRVGVAVTDPDQTMAFPFDVYVRRSERLDDDYFRRLADEEQIVRFIVGLPLHLDGRMSEKALEAQRFGARLSALTGRLVEYMDERFTSVEALGQLREAKWTRKKRQKRLDAVAAQIMLEHYLERGGHGTDNAEAIDDESST